MSDEWDEGVWIAGDGVLSNESSFYGDEESEKSLEDRVFSDDDVMHYWSTIHPRQQSVIAYRRVGSSVSTEAVKPAEVIESTQAVEVVSTTEAAILSRPPHPHDGRPHSWQLAETVSEFLARLPPSTAKAEDIGPWLYVRNPLEPSSSDSTTTKVAAFVAKGTDLLHRFENEKATLQHEQAKFKRKSTALLNTHLDRLSQQLRTDIFVAARESGVTTGKWMVFPTADRVDEFWAAVAGATVNGELGIEAKVATDKATEGNASTRLIAVYTRDYEDKDDVRRVLQKLEDLGLVKVNQKPIYYKCDAFTYLEINSKNPYELKASMYSSKDLLKRKI